MADYAWACRITQQNKSAIASENPKFDKGEFDRWLLDHDVSYFVRDPDSVFDCRYMSEVVFNELYIFATGDEGALFRRITKK